MKNLIVISLLLVLTGCGFDSYNDSVDTIRNLKNICNRDTFRITRSSEGEKEVVTVTCIRQFKTK